MKSEEVKRMVPEDYFRFRTFHEPAISPNGALGAVVVKSADGKGDRFTQEILIIDLETGTSRTIVKAGEAVRSLAWAPDGTALAWIAHQAQTDFIALLHTVDIFDVKDASNDPGPITRVFEAPSLGSSLYWTADGDGFLVTVPKVTPPETGIRIYSSSQYKHDGKGLIDPLSTEVWQISRDASRLRRLFTWDGPIHSDALSPDAQAYAFTAPSTPDNGVFVQDLFCANCHTGEVKRLMAGQGMVSSPAFAADGRHIVVLASRSHLETDETVALWLIEQEGGPAREIAPHFDRPALAMGTSDLGSSADLTGPQYSPDGKSVYFLATDAGQSRLYHVDLASGEPHPVNPPERLSIDQYAVAPSGRFIYSASDSTHPDELFLWDGRGERQLTQLNAGMVQGMNLRPVQSFSFQGAEGWPVAGFLQLPPEDLQLSPPYPLVLMIHGGPRGAFGLGFHYDVQTLAARGLAVLFVNPRGSDTYGKDFANAVIGEWGHQDYEDLMAAVDTAIERKIADPARLGVTGYSYGGFMSAWMIGHTNRFKAAAPGGCVSNLVSFHGTSDIGWYWGPKQHQATVWENMEHLWSMSPLAYVQHVQTPCLLYHAEGDDRCPIGQTEELYAALKALGQDVTFVRYPDESHVGLWRGGKPSLRVDVVRRIADWFADRLQDES